MLKQRTLKTVVTATGVGLHSGAKVTLTLRPAAPDTGIVFHRVDVRLAARLLEMANDNRVAATHQSLAVELGTAREVISRTLAEFQRQGWVETGRGEIHILARGALERLARSVT